jgi:hypothetical protein
VNAKDPLQHKCSASTCCRPERAKISRSPGGQGTARRRRPFVGRAYRDPREPLTWIVTYRGGNNGWVEIKARGDKGFFHICSTLADVMSVISGKGLTTEDSQPL